MPKLDKQQINILMFGTGLLMGFVPYFVWGGAGILLMMIILRFYKQ